MRYLHFATGTGISLEEANAERRLFSNPNAFIGELFGHVEQGTSLVGINITGFYFPTGDVPLFGILLGQDVVTGTNAGRQAIFDYYLDAGRGLRLATIEILADGTYGAVDFHNVTTKLGNSSANKLFGNGTAENIFGRAGADTIFGGAGSADWLYGGRGNDRLFAGNDSRLANLSVDRLYGGLGDDFIKGSFRGDLLVGENGNDTLLGNGTAGTRTEVGKDGSDNVYGGAGNDFIDTRIGIIGDSIFGGIGNDTILASTFGDSTIFGGDGRDLISGTAIGDLGGNFLREIRGGNGADTISGNGNLYGDGGADWLRVMPISIPGQKSNFFGGSGADTLVLGGFDISAWGGSDIDRFIIKLMDFGGLWNYANVTIYDFERGVEKIDLSRLEIADFEEFEQVSFTSFGLYRTSFRWDGDGEAVNIEIVHDRGVQITSDDFLFA